MTAKEKPTSVKFLQWIYLLTIVSIIGGIILLHNTSANCLDILRIPTFFRLSEPYLGFSYESIMTVYHFFLAYFMLIIFINAVSLFWYPNKFLKQLGLLSSVAGFFLIGLIILYFLYSVVAIGFSSYSAGISALVYLLISLAFFLLDIATFFVEKQGIYNSR